MTEPCLNGAVQRHCFIQPSGRSSLGWWERPCLLSWGSHTSLCTSTGKELGSPILRESEDNETDPISLFTLAARNHTAKSQTPVDVATRTYQSANFCSTFLLIVQFLLSLPFAVTWEILGGCISLRFVVSRPQAEVIIREAKQGLKQTRLPLPKPHAALDTRSSPHPPPQGRARPGSCPWSLPLSEDTGSHSTERTSDSRDAWSGPSF